MSRRFAVLCLALTSIGCTRFAGPREVRQSGPAVMPGYTISEQERRGRARYTILEDDIRIGPKTYSDRPSPTGR